jgi:hypothetical protein
MKKVLKITVNERVKAIKKRKKKNGIMIIVATD